MIVECMLLDELRKEIEKDSGVHRKVQYHWETIRKDAQNAHVRIYKILYLFFTRQKQLYGIRGMNYGKSFKYYLVVYYYTSEGMTACRLPLKQILLTDPFWELMPDMGKKCLLH
ncbi:MAG: hypothetical protein ABIT08_13595 [Bacteroidia bacterium]